MRRMDDGRIPKDIMFGELKEGKRKRGRPKLRYKDVVKEPWEGLLLTILNGRPWLLTEKHGNPHAR